VHEFHGGGESGEVEGGRPARDEHHICEGEESGRLVLKVLDTHAQRAQ
jgi:hypothetical protein